MEIPPGTLEWEEREASDWLSANHIILPTAWFLPVSLGSQPEEQVEAVGDQQLQRRPATSLNGKIQKGWWRHTSNDKEKLPFSLSNKKRLSKIAMKSKYHKRHVSLKKKFRERQKRSEKTTYNNRRR